MYPQSIAQSVYAAMTQRISYFEGPKVTLLAPVITITTPGAIACPSCFDATRGQAVVPDDPTCLGTGFLIPATETTPAQAGYLTPFPFEFLIVQNADLTQATAAGLVGMTSDIVLWPTQTADPKKLDVFIEYDAITPTVTNRYVIQDTLEPTSLGRTLIVERATVALQRHGTTVYHIPLPDLSPIQSGSWE